MATKGEGRGTRKGGATGRNVARGASAGTFKGSLKSHGKATAQTKRQGSLNEAIAAVKKRGHQLVVPAEVKERKRQRGDFTVIRIHVGEAPARAGRTGGGSSRPRATVEAPLEIVRVHPPIHPGAILREEFMEPLGVTAYAVAKACHMNRSKLERIVREELGISGDTAVRLGRYFGTSDQFWMNLQATYEVLKARQEIGAEAEEIQPLQAAE